MYIIRDIFQLKFGHFKEVRDLLEEAERKGLLPQAKSKRVLTDFTGDAYRLILEEGFDTLSDYEKQLSSGMATEDWQSWYKRFKEHAENSHREILKQVM
jgi:hypothetical protein